MLKWKPKIHYLNTLVIIIPCNFRPTLRDKKVKPKEADKTGKEMGACDSTTKPSKVRATHGDKVTR